MEVRGYTWSTGLSTLLAGCRAEHHPGTASSWRLQHEIPVSSPISVEEMPHLKNHVLAELLQRCHDSSSLSSLARRTSTRQLNVHLSSTTRDQISNVRVSKLLRPKTTVL